MNHTIIQEVRSQQPLIHHITNQVVMNFSANGLLAFGGAPVMAKAEEEAAHMAGQADALLLNIGTLTLPDIGAMIEAGKAANRNNIPVVFDPVGVAATPFRDQAVQQILQDVRPTVIKGNAGELAHLVDIPWQTKGVESVGDGNTEEIAGKVAATYQTTALLTGKTDIIHTGEAIFYNLSGHQLLTRITGAGCLLGSVLAACLTTDHPVNEQAQTAAAFYGLAAGHAASRPEVSGTGTFLPRFLDALALDPGELEEVK
ncbi:hydroxyethylthiazole kinase [Lentibacillus sediminis]|uniref:hydroxyethylthiazole kinase n=1 Tax=Lentibacillus sediminis TaxID=1940529 RepID=UPI000C1C5E96|nr:hydroxyethylthiazole kinase [Lentibacillus sediminis]